MKNLLFYGSTNYGKKLSKSDNLKFIELDKHFNTHVMTLGNNRENIKHNNVQISYLKKPKLIISQYLYFYFFNFRNFKNYCFENKIDIVSAKDPIAGFIPVIYKKIYDNNIKIIIEHHGDFLDLLLNQRKFNLKFFIKIIAKSISEFTYRNCDFIRGVEKTFTEKLADKYKKNYHYFPAWVDYTIFKKDNLDRKNFLFIGNIIPRKGVDFIIKNFNDFSLKNNFKEKLLIIGENQNSVYFNKCIDFVKQNEIKNIEFLGKKSQEEISYLLSSSRLLIMASNYEGLPRVLIESGLCATPSLATDIQGIKEPFGSDGGTLIYQLNNSFEFKSQLNIFVNDKNLEHELQNKAHSLATKLSGANNFGNNWSKLIESLYE